jgi:putative transposase
MRYDPDKHHRRSTRLRHWDYAQPGFYFLTFCAQDRQCLFGQIIDCKMQLNQFGQIVAEEWHRSQMIRQELKLDAWVIMPNHFHALVQIIHGPIPPPLPASPHFSMRPKSISSLVAGFKSITTTKINQLRRSPGHKVWQRNYYDSIVYTDRGLAKVRRYIANNPYQWHLDQLHPAIKSKW